MNKFQKRVHKKVKKSTFLEYNYSYYRAKKYIKFLHRYLVKYHGFSGMSVNLKDKKNRNIAKVWIWRIVKMKHDPLAYECQKCCIGCDEDEKTCKYKKARGNLIRRQIYALKKKEEKEGKS